MTFIKSNYYLQCYYYISDLVTVLCTFAGFKATDLHVNSDFQSHGYQIVPTVSSPVGGTEVLHYDDANWTNRWCLLSEEKTLTFAYKICILKVLHLKI